ncbi:MgtC/SapB family protein [Methylobacterium sp. J-026]|uniref:MgtC/SapB family protein n=1 Tax=Methylobacterium sp. J-026 TaxID=2836624 RepID=UPI001FBB983C|nr:MgtC/SapB family protein [Methylobacterium sp. J-026]MCJ2137929.1 MgtC/SapB family protein [Methylobacterium sp. J-026]
MIGNGEMVARLALAALSGSVIGLERERLLWAAGLRTHMLVCVGSCLIMIVSAYGFGDVLGADHVVLDPSRIAAQVVSGIGFLGAGTILLRGEVVKGLTTAASLWGVAAIGLAVGSGLYVPALTTTALVVGILAGVKPFEERWRARMRTQTLRLTVRKDALSIDTLQAATGERASRVRTFTVRPSADPDYDEVAITFVRLSRTSVAAIAAKLRALPDVVTVEEAEA